MVNTIKQEQVVTHIIDEVDTNAAYFAGDRTKESARNIYENPAESATLLFDMLGETYKDRQIIQRIHHGDEVIDSRYIGTRTPDMTGIDELYGEFTVYGNDPTSKQQVVTTQRIVTMFDGRGGWRKIVVDDNCLRVVDHNNNELSGDRVTDAVMDFTFRTHQAIATYQARTQEEQQAANADAKDKLRQFDIYEQRGFGESLRHLGRAGVSSTTTS